MNEEKVLNALKKEYEEVSYMLDWHGHDGSHARTVAAVIEKLLENLGYNLKDIEWIEKK